MASLRAISARIRDADPFRVDIALTAVILAAWLVDAGVARTHHGDRVLTALIGVIAFVPLAWRRREPVLVAAWFGFVALVQEAFDDSFFLTTTTVPVVVGLLITYTLGRHTEGRRMLAGAAALMVGVYVALLLEPKPGIDDLVWVLFLFGAPLLAGRALRNRASLQRELRQKAEDLEAEGQERSRLAMERERARIATELQSVVANGVSAMVVQAEAVPRLITGQQAGRAAEA